jgi:predicted nucleotidyltransferase component of viral defense system
MIDRGEIVTKAEELDLHPSNVQRDYVFGWLLSGLFREDSASGPIALKGGNGLRKGYLPSTRFSDDLDFTSSGSLDGEALVNQFNEICRWAERMCGVHFDTDRNLLADEHHIDRARTVYKLRLYFQDFSGDAGHITLKVRVDVTEYDRIVPPLQQRALIHPYSDSAECATTLQLVKLEELLADKLKCMLQRRHSHDLYDLVQGVFIQRGVELDRRELVQPRSASSGSMIAARSAGPRADLRAFDLAPPLGVLVLAYLIGQLGGNIPYPAASAASTRA